MNEYIGVLQKYWCFEGRAGRREYWMFFLFNLIFAVAFGLVVGILAGITHIKQLSLLANLYTLAVLCPGLGVTVRRLHDTNRSGWWQLLFLIPILGPIVLIVFEVQQGTPGDNNYGPASITTNK